MAIVTVAALQMPPGDQAARAHAVHRVEWMADKPVGDREPRQKPPTVGLFWLFRSHG
jgi:hypothetical protein